MKYTTYYIMGAMSLVPALVKAQADTTLTQSLTIERSYSPVFKEASKIDRQPAIEEVKVVPTQITYAERKSESVRPNEITDMGVGQVIVEAEPEQGGYVDFSAGNYWNADLKTGYHYGDFSLDAAGFFTSGKLKTPYSMYNADQDFEQLKWQSKLGKGSIVAGYEHTLGNDANLNAHASFGGAFANSFPFAMRPYFYIDDNGNEQKDIFQQEIEKAQSQRWGQILLDAEYVAERYDIKFEFEHVGIRQPAISENALNLEANLLAYQNDHWLFTAGLNTGLTFSEKENFFTIKPEVELSYIPGYSWRRLYAKLGIGTYRENPYELMNAVPLIAMGEYSNTFDIFNLTLGWEDSEHGAFKYGFYANFKKSKNEINGFLVPMTVFGNAYVILDEEDCFDFNLNAYFNYEANRFFGAKGEFTYNHENCNLQGFGSPDIITKFHLLGHTKKVDLDLCFHGEFLRGMQWWVTDPINPRFVMWDGQEKLDELDLGNIANLNFRADYKYSKALTFYGFANNIFNHKYQLWPGVPAQGINIHVGANWKF